MSNSTRFEVTVLGSGTSTGVPVIGCSCDICKSTSPYNKRLRSSIFISDKKLGRNILIDTTPDLREQLLRENIHSIDYVFFTHTHADHCHGLDDLRPLFFRERKTMKVWADPDHEIELRDRFYYMFRDTGYAGIKPSLEFLTKEELLEDFTDPFIETASLPHGSTNSTLFKLGSFLYATDFKTFPEELIEKWKGKIEVMIASAPTYKPHGTHSSIPETIEIFKKLEVKEGYLTHLSHQVDHKTHSLNLSKNIFFAYDGLKLQVNP